jgi:hypothetical protein
MEKVPQNGRTPQPVSAYDWDTGIYTYDVSQMDAAQIWRSAVALAATRARQTLPECSTRIDKAIELVLTNAVELHADGSATVTSQRHGDMVYTVVHGTCDCADFAQAPSRHCKHRLSRALVLRARAIATQLRQAERFVTLGPEELTATLEPEPSAEAVRASRIPAGFLYERQGTTAIFFGGLLHMAHEQGLLSLTVDVVSVSADLAVMRATARFKDGGQWTDIGDATPQNVGARIAPHFIRMASTRAMARCLRTALDIPYVCSVELADE